MSTIPFSQPQTRGVAQPGQTGLPGNTASNTVTPNYGFLSGVQTPQARTATGTTGTTGTTSTIPTYTANQFIGTNPANPFNQYTGFNLGAPGSGTSAEELHKMFGPLGDTLYYYMQSGMGYNPAVLTSLLNQIQPEVQRGMADLGATGGATGNRFGSAYQLGLGDYLSRVNQNELGLASQLYGQSQQNIYNTMTRLLPMAGEWTSNKGGFGTALAASLIPALANSGILTGIWNTAAGTLDKIPGIDIPSIPYPSSGRSGTGSTTSTDPTTGGGPYGTAINPGTFGRGTNVSVDPNTGTITLPDGTVILSGGATPGTGQDTVPITIQQTPLQSSAGQATGGWDTGQSGYDPNAPFGNWSQQQVLDWLTSIPASGTQGGSGSYQSIGLDWLKLLGY